MSRERISFEVWDAYDVTMKLAKTLWVEWHTVASFLPSRRYTHLTLQLDWKLRGSGLHSKPLVDIRKSDTAELLGKRLAAYMNSDEGQALLTELKRLWR